MDGVAVQTVRFVFSILSSVTALYSLVVFMRVLLGWFRNVRMGRAYSYLCRICDPYLNWFSRFRFLRTSRIDFSPIAGFIVLNILSGIFSRIAQTGYVTLGFFLSLIFSIAWSVVSFIIGFFIIVVILRLIAYCINANIYHPFWNVIDYISRPIIYRVSRIFFRTNITNFFSSIILSIITLVILYVGLHVLSRFVTAVLLSLPV